MDTGTGMGTGMGMTDVLVVGAGPTGLVLACDLARRGVAVRIVDRSPAPPRTSRAKGPNPRSLEILDDLGVADEVLAMRLGAAADAQVPRPPPGRGGRSMGGLRADHGGALRPGMADRPVAAGGHPPRPAGRSRRPRRAGPRGRGAGGGHRRAARERDVPGGPDGTRTVRRRLRRRPQLCTETARDRVRRHHRRGPGDGLRRCRPRRGRPGPHPLAPVVRRGRRGDALPDPRYADGLVVPGRAGAGRAGAAARAHRRRVPCGCSPATPRCPART